MNIRKYTQWAESPVINNVGQRPTNRNWSWNQAPTGRNPVDFAPSGLVRFNDRALPYPNDDAITGQQTYY